MRFTGKSLELIRDGMEMAISDCHNEIATCPDVNVYAAEIALLEAKQIELVKLLRRIQHAIEYEP
jgi:hypothetical protein